MISAIKTSTGQKVIATYTEKANAPFHCPECLTPVIIKKGLIKIHHFVHKVNTGCNYGTPESELHMSCKLSIYEQIKNIDGYENVEVEKIIGDFIADIYAEYRGVKVAFEIQVSNMNLKTLLNKLNGYSQKNIYGFWVVPNYEILQGERHSPKIWEKLLYKFYKNQIFYMLKNGKIISSMFKPHMLWKEATDWGGGYYYKSKRYVEIQNNGYVDLTKLCPQDRESFTFSSETVIRGRVFVPNSIRYKNHIIGMGGWGPD